MSLQKPSKVGGYAELHRRAINALEGQKEGGPSDRGGTTITKVPAANYSTQDIEEQKDTPPRTIHSVVFRFLQKKVQTLKRCLPLLSHLLSRNGSSSQKT
eukprot:3291869-Amphidinium_carterae.1